MQKYNMTKGRTLYKFLFITTYSLQVSFSNMSAIALLMTWGYHELRISGKVNNSSVKMIPVDA